MQRGKGLAGPPPNAPSTRAPDLRPPTCDPGLRLPARYSRAGSGAVPIPPSPRAVSGGFTQVRKGGKGALTSGLCGRAMVQPMSAPLVVWKFGGTSVATRAGWETIVA